LARGLLPCVRGMQGGLRLLHHPVPTHLLGRHGQGLARSLAHELD
jgi:hypothetical protein